MWRVRPRLTVQRVDIARRSARNTAAAGHHLPSRGQGQRIDAANQLADEGVVAAARKYGGVAGDGGGDACTAS